MSYCACEFYHILHRQCLIFSYVLLQFCTVTVRNINEGNLVFNINVSKYNTEAGGEVPEVNNNKL
jgi:hypothetical protein